MKLVKDFQRHTTIFHPQASRRWSSPHQILYAELLQAIFSSASIQRTIKLKKNNNNNKFELKTTLEFA